MAIQLNDSIIVASDNKTATILEDDTLTFSKENISKIHSWENGIVTGTGEYYVISNAVRLFNNFKKLPHHYFADCLDISRKLREFEIGTEYYQVAHTKLMYSTYTENGAQLYRVESFDQNEKYQVTAADKMDITVWMFDPKIEIISMNLKELYGGLKDRSFFKNNDEWVNYYIEHLAPIFKKKSQQDFLVSQSFDVFFQTKDQYIYGEFPNI
ncbi:hypothetical protein [Acinetobacter sp. 161(2023)]|uniref:hypothetical protein n=1 Tax=Acinetobacter sp. 161(2023) TaxID=3098768 RepID=UPI00300BD643